MSLHVTEPGIDVWLLPHFRQDDAPEEGEYVLIGHFVHVIEPSASAYFPASQDVQALVRPEVLEAVPTAHGIQEPIP